MSDIWVGCSENIARPLSYHVHHGVVELAVADNIVIILVDFRHDLLPDALIFFLKGRLADTSVEDRPKFIFTDLTVAISVEQVESYLEILLVQELGPVDSCSDEFTVVDLLVLIGVQLLD